jgi:hypothetical protein
VSAPPNGPGTALVPANHHPDLGPHTLTGRDPPVKACVLQSPFPDTKEEA